MINYEFDVKFPNTFVILPDLLSIDQTDTYLFVFHRAYSFWLFISFNIMVGIIFLIVVKANLKENK